jgi:tripartite-type tricarboxylate transporter receptor subunit TctC
MRTIHCVVSLAIGNCQGGPVEMMANSTQQASQQLKPGRLRALAVSGRDRSTALHDIHKRRVKQSAEPACLAADSFSTCLAAPTPVVAKACRDAGPRLDG